MLGTQVRQKAVAVVNCDQQLNLPRKTYKLLQLWPNNLTRIRHTIAIQTENFPKITYILLILSQNTLLISGTDGKV